MSTNSENQSSPTGNQSAVVSALKRTGSTSTTTAVVKVVQPKAGKQQKSSWVWKAMQEFKPPMNGKNVRCVIEVTKKGVRQPCGQMFAHKASNGTSALKAHFRISIPARTVQSSTRYVAEGVHPDVDNFSLTGVWLRRSSPTLAECTSTSVAPAEMPHLALIARLYQ